MKYSINILMIWSIYILVFNVINAMSIGFKESKYSHLKPKNYEIGDSYYAILIDNSLLINDDTNKNQENKYIFASMVNELHSLIMKNKHTFDDVKEFNKINRKKLNLSNKEVEEKYLMNEGDSNLVFPISSLKEKSILRAYLSTKLVEDIMNMNYVIDCVPYNKYISNAYSY